MIRIPTSAVSNHEVRLRQSQPSRRRGRPSPLPARPSPEEPDGFFDPGFTALDDARNLRPPRADWRHHRSSSAPRGTKISAACTHAPLQLRWTPPDPRVRVPFQGLQAAASNTGHDEETSLSTPAHPDHPAHRDRRHRHGLRRHSVPSERLPGSADRLAGGGGQRGSVASRSQARPGLRLAQAALARSTPARTLPAVVARIPRVAPRAENTALRLDTGSSGSFEKCDLGAAGRRLAAYRPGFEGARRSPPWAETE